MYRRLWFASLGSLVALVCCVLVGCKEKLPAEQSAILASVALSAKERAAAAKVIKIEVKGDNAEQIRKYLVQHSDGLDAQAVQLADFAKAAELGGGLSKKAREMLREEAETATTRAENFAEISKLIAADEPLRNWMDAHHAALVAQAEALQRLAKILNPPGPPTQTKK